MKALAGKVLVIDSCAEDRQTLCGLLRKEYGVLEADRGDEALALLRCYFKSICAIVLDLELADASGFDVLTSIYDNALWRQLPVVVVSRRSDEDTQRRVYAQGVNWFVQKPYHAELFVSALRNNIGMREGLRGVSAAQRDKLTGLYTRDVFFALTERLVRRAEPGAYVLSCFDVDNFKVINDQYGVDMGDDVLCHVADTISRYAARIEGHCCRVSADVFGVLFPAKYVDSKLLLDAHRAAFAPRCINRTIRIRIGRYLITDLSLPASTMFDRAMLAQESIRGRCDLYIASYNDGMRKRLLREQMLVQEMNGALEREEFEVWLQPQFNHATGAMIGSEALVRWRLRGGELIPPGEFIPIFERNGFIYELDKYVWERVCRTLRRWILSGLPLLPISVNISRFDVFHEDFADVITGLVVKYDLPVELMHLEITESAFTENDEQVTKTVKALIRLGFTIEIDDFGSGFSSLNTLKDVPASVLKLDMRFLENRDDAQRGGSILESVVRMAKWLGMSVIAEGVETKPQADYLKSIGCHFLQGYFFAHPMPIPEYEKLSAAVRIEHKTAYLETVEALDSNAFWNPNSMETLIFNSYVGGAIIVEYHNGQTEVIRSNDRFAKEFAGKTIGGVPVYKLAPAECMDAENYAIMLDNIKKAIETRVESTCELRIAVDGKKKDEALYLRCTVRMIARAEERCLLYCVIYNISSLRIAEKKERELVDRLQAIINALPSGVSAITQDERGMRFLFANDQVEAAECLRLREEEYRLAIRHTGNVICRYDVSGRTLTMAPEYAAQRGIPETVSDMPDGMIRLGCISGESEKAYAEFYHKIERGEKYGSVVVRVRFPEGWRTLEGRFSTLFSAEGKPVSAVLSYADVTERLDKETVYKKWQQSLREKKPGSYSLFRTNLTRPELPVSVEGTLLHYAIRPGAYAFNERTREYAELWVYQPDRAAYLKRMDSDALLAGYYRGKRSFTMEYREKLKCGGTRWLRLTAELVERLNSTDIEAYLMYENIDSSKKAELLTKERAETDPLTGVLNRKAFEERMTRALAQRAKESLCALFMLDLDCFKRINDSFGHDKGDRMRIEVGQTLSSIFRNQDLICRLGGDEFLVFIANVPNRGLIAHKAEKICAQTRKSLSPSVQSSVSVGIAVCPDDGDDFETLYRRVDIALYSVKATGKNNFAFYSPDMRRGAGGGIDP